MPVKQCMIENKPGYKWGEAGKCYPYNPNDEKSKKDAKKKALAQGIAIGDIEMNNKYSMDFLKENDFKIIRNIHDPDKFIDDSFETFKMGVGITFIVGKPKDQNLIQMLINPDRLMVQSVHFSKPDWTLDSALEWLKDNQRHFEIEYKSKKYAKKELKSISEVEIFSAGTWNGDKYTVEDLDAMVQAFNDTHQSIRPFIKLGHSDKQKLLESEGLPAAGWIGKIYRKGEKLLADFVDIPNKIYELIENKAYRKVSSEIYVGVQIKDRKYKYMLGAVALLGAETPGVMNLSDILARFGLKDYHSIKSYAQNENDVELKSYSIENEIKINNQGDPMSKTEKEIELELRLKKAQEQLDAVQAESKQFKADLDAKEEDLKKVQDAKLEAEKKAFEMEQKAFETEIEKQADQLVAGKLISKSMRPYAVALLKNDQDQETKKYSFKIDKEEKSLDRFELIKEFATLAQKTSEVNFDDNSEDGKKNNDGVNEAEIEKYASDHNVSYGQAYRELYSGKLQVEKPHVKED